MGKETKAILYTGGKVTLNTKSLNPWNDEDTPEAWTPYEDPKKKAVWLVPAVFNAWQARCKAMADLPFTIYGKGDKAVDDSDEYQNIAGFLANPRQFFWMCEASLVGYGRAYWSKAKNSYQYTKQLKYFEPTSITPHYDVEKGLDYFERKNGNITVKLPPEDVLYIWLPDPCREIGEPSIWPLQSALGCAGALERINNFVGEFMNRGMVKATMLTIEGAVTPPTPEQVDQIETFWNKFMRGVATRIHLFNNNVKPTIVGEGLEAFRGIEITTELMQQINTAMGTRQLLEDENYATAQIRQREFYVTTIMPDARLIADALNTQVLDAYDYHLEFESERLEIFKEDEAERAQALSVLAATLTNSSPEAITLSMSILGYSLSDEDKATLTALINQKEKAREQMAAVTSQPTESQPEEAPSDEPMRQDMAKFLRKALKKVGQDVAFESDNIDSLQLIYIHEHLAQCKCADEVRALFATDVTEAPKFAQDDPILVLADSIRQAVKALDETANLL